MKKVGLKTVLAILTALVALASLMVLRQSGKSMVRAQTDSPGASGHDHHRPPGMKGSDLYQYAEPREGKAAEAAVYPPEAPPSTPAPNGVREYTLVVEEDIPHDVAPGVSIPAWTFNRSVPAPVLRATEGDRVRITLVNKGKLPHTIHFHGVHPADMDGVFELVPPGESYTYDFIVRPFGVFPYHCHSNPSSQHILNGLYGMFIVDPKTPRPPAKELAMVMSAFDLDRDGEADFYAWNGRAFQYADHPVELKKGEPVRMYVLNMFEEPMAPHIHANMFGLIRSGTKLRADELTDVLSLAIAERAILEFQYDYPGTYMFQCHFSEHMEQGLMGWFNVVDPQSTTAQAGPPKGHGHHGGGR
ncbi:MAG: multicopper oxidase domain-containing protein [Acidobacteria bacterium]|nr:multicopper oxidase domain-containing protein [Acidobacteriota bacterium]